MKYFLKKCGFQELGSVGADGKAKRGRYLMSSLKDEVVDFFPPLSIEIPNDTALLPVIPLYTGEKTYCSYVYHNSKYTGTTASHPRNEYRIYLNSEIEAHQLYFAAEDIVIFRKKRINDAVVDEQEQCIYYVDLLKDHSNPEYLKLSQYIDQYPIRGGYGIFDGVLDFFEERVNMIEAGEFVSDIHIDKSVTNRISNSTDENRMNIFNEATFRDFVLAGYGNACAITGQKVDGLFGNDVNVVYIRPKYKGGSCLPSNGLALVNRLSLPFIEGKFTLSDDYEVIVHPESDLDELNEYANKQIRIPPNSFFMPDKANLEFHRSEIYGNFLNKGE